MRVCIFFIFLFFSFQNKAQSEVDSLRALLSGTLPDTTRVQALNALSSKSFYKDPIATDSLASLAIELARSENFIKGLTAALRNKGISHAIRGNFETAREHYNEALGYLDEDGHFEEKSSLYYAIGITYTETGKYDLAKTSFVKGLTLQKEIGDSVRMANTYVGIGNFYKKISQFSLSAVYLDSAASIYLRLDMPSELAIVRHNQANVYTSLDNYPKALESIQMALSYNEENGLDQKTAVNYHTIGSIYNYLEELDKAKEYYLKSFALKKRLGMVQGMALSLSNLGALLIKKEEFDQAKITFQQVNMMYDSLQLTCNKPYADLNLGIISLKTGKTDSAKHYLARALKGSQDCQLNEVAAQSLSRLGELYQSQHQLAKAEDAYLQAMEIGDKDNLMSIRSDAATHLYQLYQEQQKPLQAYKYLKVASSLKDSLYNEENNRKIARLESKYEFDKEKAILKEKFEKEQLAQQAEVEKQILFRDMALAIAALLLTIVIGTTVFYFKLKRSKELLEAQNKQITSQKKKLEELNQTNDKLLSLLSHDLRNPLHGIQGIISMLKDDCLSKSEIEEMSMETDIRIRNLLQFLDNILNWSQNSFSKLKANKEAISLNQTIEEIILLLKPIADVKNVVIRFEPDANHMLMADEAMLKIVFRNLLSNAIKFSNSGDHIDIRTSNDQDNIQVAFMDYGMGMKEEVRRKLFASTVTSNEGTGKEMGAGLGLFLSQDFMNLHGGNIHVQSEEGKGSTFTVILPATEAIKSVTA